MRELIFNCDMPGVLKARSIELLVLELLRLKIFEKVVLYVVRILVNVNSFSILKVWNYCDEKYKIFERVVSVLFTKFERNL